MRPTFGIFFAVALFLSTTWVRAETIPPKPTRYFEDNAHLVSASTAQTLNRRLEQFERETSNQVLVVTYPRMDSASSVEDYTVRIAQAWQVGQKERKNGAVLFVFQAEHQTYIQVGYGLEAVLPDALCFTIVRDEINPRFRTGDFSGGLSAGINSIISATRGEYRGTGATQNQRQGRAHGSSTLIAFLVVLIFMGLNFRRSRGGGVYGNRRFGGGWFPPMGGGGGWGGGSSSGGGGGFSSGGGSFGGGGAGGKW